MMAGADARLIFRKCSSWTLPSVKPSGTTSVVQSWPGRRFQRMCGQRVRSVRVWAPNPQMSACTACGSEPAGANVHPKPRARNILPLSAACPCSSSSSPAGGAGAGSNPSPPGATKLPAPASPAQRCSARCVTEIYQRGPLDTQGASCSWLGPGLYTATPCGFKRSVTFAAAKAPCRSSEPGQGSQKSLKDSSSWMTSSLKRSKQDSMNSKTSHCQASGKPSLSSAQPRSKTCAIKAAGVSS
mmetsp:Transcript_81051/g.206003  ORF Transcript_81051/g.206003 Transcript_81051/m.206003 type:complete len:242 (-) Transcript_81051:990-1715(-)